ncbi:MAG TPA: MEDS domain-containing protein, partial [Candidatus Angelobacter sp.]|nr:MEDS domain-containing protein [Candidatus Angelobacter sp.]
MIVFLLRNSLSYFQSYRNYFVAIYLIFLAFPAGDLILIASSAEALQRLSILGFVTSGSLIATIWGYVATKLYVYPETLSPKRLISRPFRPIFLAYALYLLPMLIALTDGWIDPLAISPTPIRTVFPLDNTTSFSSTVSLLLVGIGGSVVVAFTSYPLAVLSRRRALVKDREVRSALRLIATSFGAISLTLILGFGLLAFGQNLLGPVNFLSVILIIVAVQAFRKPTFLKSFLGVVPSLQSSPSASRYDQMLLIHGPGGEKFGPIAKYITDGVNRRERVIYFHNGDVSLVTEGLSRLGVDATRLMLKGALRPLGSAYPSKGVLNDTPLEVVRELASEAKTLGNEGLRVVLDYDEFLIRPVQKFVQHLTDPRWTSADHDMHVLMAFDSNAFRGEEASLAELERKIRTLDLSENTDAFSHTVGLSHEQIAGRKLLLEFDPQGNYDQTFKSLLAETASNFERTVVFTRKDSLIYSLVERQPAAKIFVMTSRVSYPKMESENLFLLPTYDTSLFLDALNKTIEAYAGSTYTIIFDNISHFVFTLGPDRTYSLVRQALELMISDKITAIFSMN